MTETVNTALRQLTQRCRHSLTLMTRCSSARLMPSTMLFSNYPPCSEHPAWNGNPRRRKFGFRASAWLQGSGAPRTSCNPSDDFPVGDEAFMEDHLRGAAAVVAADLRKIAILPDKVSEGQAGIQVAWALLAKTLPLRVVHLLRAHPVAHTQELCEIYRILPQPATGT